MADTQDYRGGRGGGPHEKRWFRDNGDGTFGEEISTENRVWDTNALAWVKEVGIGGVVGGGGGAATIADGADVAQGSTTDASSATTVVGLLKAIKAAVTGALTTNATLSAETTKVIGTVNVAAGQTIAATGPLTDTQLRATAVPVSLATAPTTPVTGTFFQPTQPVSISATVTVDPSGVTSPVSVASLPLPSGAATNVSAQDASTRIREMAFGQWLAHEEALFQ